MGIKNVNFVLVGSLNDDFTQAPLVMLVTNIMSALFHLTDNAIEKTLHAVRFEDKQSEYSYQL